MEHLWCWCCLSSCFAAIFVGALFFLTSPVWKRIVKYHNKEPIRSSTHKIPPGSKGLPFIGETLHFMAAINSTQGVYHFVKIRCLRFGRCFRTSIFGETHVFVSSTESAKLILNNDSGKFTKRYIRSIAELVGDQSLLCAPHHHHKLIRSRLINLFSTHSLSLIVKQFDQLVVDALSGWKSRSTVVMLDEALKITCRAMCKILISIESELELEELQADVCGVCNAMLAFPFRFPGTRFHKGLQSRRRIMNKLDQVVSERRRRTGGQRHEDFLQKLLTDDVEDEHKLTDGEIKDNILTMIIAGQDTTASAITWMVKFLDENHHVLNTLRNEHLQLAKKASPNSLLTLEDISEMHYASKVVKESLRMASVVSWIPRLALQDTEIEGYKIKKGWNVNIDARSLHLDLAVYYQPDKFNPSRFDGDQSSKLPPYSFLAFGMGGRQCLGMNMARAMMTVFLHRLITTYTWTVMDSDPSIEKWAMFSKLKTGCPVTLTPIIAA